MSPSDWVTPRGTSVEAERIYYNVSRLRKQPWGAGSSRCAGNVRRQLVFIVHQQTTSSFSFCHCQNL